MTRRVPKPSPLSCPLSHSILRSTAQPPSFNNTAQGLQPTPDRDLI